MHPLCLISTVALVLLAVPVVVWSQEPTAGPQHWPIVLNPDDVAAFPPPPAGFDRERPGIPHGKLELVTYRSNTVGTERKMLVYTPPGYSAERSYGTLYLLHGIGGDETEWQRFCAPGIILDNLYADGKLAPMIVVFPNGRAQKNDRADGDLFKHLKAFEVFTDDLLKDIVPFVDAQYPVQRDGRGRALAGFSMGGGQSLNISMSHPGEFAWVGGFSSAPNTRPPAQLFAKPDSVTSLKLLYLSCGDNDGLLAVSQGLHGYLKQHRLPHIWTVNPGGHNGEVWKLDLYHFAPLLFKDR